MNEDKMRMLEQLRDMAITDLKDSMDDDQIDEFVSSVTEKLQDAGQFPMPSATYVKTYNEVDDKVSELINTASEVVEKHFDANKTDSEILNLIVDSEESIDISDRELIEYIKVGIEQHRKFKNAMKICKTPDCTSLEFARVDNKVLYSDPLRYNVKCLICGERQTIEVELFNALNTPPTNPTQMINNIDVIERHRDGL